MLAKESNKLALENGGISVIRLADLDFFKSIVKICEIYWFDVVYSGNTDFSAKSS